MEYSGTVNSQPMRGGARAIVERDGLLLVTSFDARPIPYVEIEGFCLRDHTVRIETVTGPYEISGLGYGGEPFLDALYAAYNDKVRKALFVTDAPLLETRGEYAGCENGRAARGHGAFEVHDACVLFLPPDDGGRRVPLCFVSAMETAPHGLTLRLDDGDSHTFSKMGYDAEAFADAVEKRLRTLRQRSVEGVKALDPGLTSAQAADIARHMSEGTAAPVGDLARIAPSFVRALETKIGGSRGAQSYAFFKTVCDPARIHVGVKRTARHSEEAQGDDLMIWMIAPGKDGRTAAVEFAVAEDETASFLYRYTTDFPSFVRAFNRAFEAIGFRREVVWIRDTDLKKPEHADYMMAVKRNEMLRQIRDCFSGRVIHASPEHWKREMRKAMGA